MQKSFKKNWVSIKSRLALFIFFILCPALGLNVYLSFHLTQYNLNDARRETRNLTLLALQGYSEIIESSKHFLFMLSQSRRVQNLKPEGFDIIQKAHRNFDAFSTLTLQDKNGKTLFKSQLNENNEFFENNDPDLIKKTIRKNRLVLSSYDKKDKGEKGLLLSFPLLKNGQVVGVFIGYLTPQANEKLLSKLALPHNSTVIITTQSGTTIIDKNNINSNDISTKFSKHFRLKNYVFSSTCHDGFERFFSPAPFPYSDQEVYLSIGVPTKWLLSGAEQFYILSIYILIAAIFFGVLISWFFAQRKIVNPLHFLLKKTREIQNNNFDIHQKKSVFLEGELEDLNNAISLMAQALQERQKQLEQSQKRFLEILEITDEAIVSLDRYFKINFTNSSFEKLFGFSQEQILNRHVDILFGESMRQEYRKTFFSFAKNKRPSLKIKELIFSNHNGMNFFGSITISKTLKDEQNTYTLIIRDITEQKMILDAKEKWQKELMRSNNELEQFAYNASHDLQEPLRMVASYTKLLSSRYQEKLDDDARTFLNYACSGAERLQQMIKDLLEYSRAGKKFTQVKNISMNNIILNVSSEFAALIHETEAKIISQDLPEIIGDEIGFTCVFRNIIGNALKFRSSDKTPEIIISCEEQNDSFLFKIKDNGIGFNPQFSHHIFSLFKRLHDSQTYSGSGIGLALCKKIIEQMNGKIFVESQEKVGTCFFIKLPKTISSHDEFHYSVAS